VTKRRTRTILSLLPLVAAVCFPASVFATTATYSGSDDFGRAASVTFEDLGWFAGTTPGQQPVHRVQVTLTNTSTADVLVPVDVLTAVFFNMGHSTDFTPISAVVPNGSVVLWGSPERNVGGEWAFKNQVGVQNDNFNNAGLGISSSGLGVFGPSNLFGGTNLQGPESPDGLQYGITSAGDIKSTGNGAVTGGNALIKNSMVFVLEDGVFDVTKISDVYFQYGTCLDDAGFSGGGTSTPPGPVPEPLTMFSAFVAISGLGVYIRRRMRSPAAA